MDKKKIMKVIIIVAVIIIPVLYSFFYLKAFWDPYGNLHDMKIAIVNLDEGEGEENLGNELVDKLKEKDTMTLSILNNSDEAQEGLVNQDYYATITIPKNFTKDLNSAENSDRKVTTITYSPNQKDNYLASQIINKVVTTVETELRSEVSEKVVAKLTDKLEEVPDKMQEISDGAKQIQDGTSQLENGLQELSEGTSNLSTNYEKFDSGIESAYNGSAELTNGLNTLNAGAEKIYEGTSKLAEGTQNLSSLTQGVSTLSTGATNLNSGVSAYVDGVNQAISSITSMTKQMQTLGGNLQAYVKAHPEAMQDTNFASAIGQLQTISNASSNTKSLATLQSKGTELKQGASNLNTGIKTLASSTSSLSTLSSSVQTLNSGMLELKQGITSAKTGSETLQAGLQELNTNSKIIKTGTSQLNDGAKQALTGSQTLLDGVNTFNTEIDNGIQDTKEQLKNLDGLAEYTAAPVKIEETNYAQVNSYGVGFAPYFMSISLWVGALIMMIVFYYDPEDRFKLLGRNAKNKYLRSGIYFVIAVAQGIVLGFILKAGLGFSVTNMGLYYGSCILTSVVFFSILQFLVIKLGDVGKFLGILFLVLQLAASGGTFPIETVPSFFQAIYKFMPMNYTIRLMKEALIKVDSGMVASNVGILVGISVVFIAITLIVDYIKTNYIDKKKNANE